MESREAPGAPVFTLTRSTAGVCPEEGVTLVIKVPPAVALKVNGPPPPLLCTVRNARRVRVCREAVRDL